MRGARRFLNLFRPRLFSVRFFLFVMPLSAAFVILMVTMGLRTFQMLAMSSISDKANGISRNVAYNIAPSLVFGDKDSAGEIVSGASTTTDVIFLAVLGETGVEIASSGDKASWTGLDYQRLLGGAVSADGRTYLLSRPIVHKDKEIGRLLLGLSLEGVHGRLDSLKTRLLWLGLGLIIVGGIGIYLLSFLVTRPLRRVSEAARRIARGDTSQRVPVRTLDETGHLASDFNSMVEALNQARDTLEAKVEERTRELKVEIGERKKAEDALRESEEKFRSMIRTMGEGVGMISESEDFLFANEAAAEIFGVPLESLVGKNLAEFIGRGAFEDVRKQTERRKKGERGSYELDIVRPDGAGRTVLLSSIPRFNAAGTFEGALSVFTDITGQKASERELQEVNEKLKTTIRELERRAAENAVISDLYDAYQACRDEGEILAATGRYGAKLFPGTKGVLYIFKPSRNMLDAVAGWGESDLFRNYIFPDDCWALRRGKAYVIDPPGEDPVCPHVSAGDWAGESYICAPLIASGSVTGLLHIRCRRRTREEQRDGVPGRTTQKGLAQNFAERVAMALENQRLRDTLRSQSIRDPLTGLYNRRFMEEAFEKEVFKSARNGASLGVIMIDIDRFKTFNDAFGHEAGDEMLKAVATYLSTSVRKGDIVCRYGGEEFLVILPGASIGAAMDRAEKLCEGIRPLRVDFRDLVLGPVSISLGVAAYPLHGGTGPDVVMAADMALLEAKRLGRDRAVPAGS